MAQRFNGTAANYLSRTASLLSINAAYTWMAWIKIVTDTNANALIYSAGNNAGTQNDTVLLDTDGTTLTLSVNAATMGGTNLTVGTWYHVALVRTSATDVKVYLNGVQDSSSTTNVGTSRTMENMLAGSFLGVATPFNGAMDAAKAWSRALSVVEIQNEMMRHQPASTASLYAWWPMVHSTAALSAKDYGGSAADWTVNGTLTIEQGSGIPWGGSPVTISSATAVAAALASSVSAQCTATAALSTSIVLAAAPAASTAVSAALSTAIRLAGAAAGQCTVTAALSTQIAMASAVGDVVTIGAALTTAIALASAAQSVVTISATMNGGAAALSTSVAATCTVSAALSTQIQLAAGPQAATTVSAGLTTAIRLAAAPAGQCTVSAALTTAIRMAATAQGVVTVSAGFSGTAAALAASVQGGCHMTAALTTAISMAAQAISQAQASAALTTKIAMEAIVQAQTTLTVGEALTFMRAPSGAGFQREAPVSSRPATGQTQRPAGSNSRRPVH